jgi:hypothetical protein
MIDNCAVCGESKKIFFIDVELGKVCPDCLDCDMRADAALQSAQQFGICRPKQ